MIAKNMDELKAMIMRDARKAVKNTSSKAIKNMQTEISKFYTSASPVMYERTGALRKTPTVSPVTATSNSAEFKAYLDDSHVYSTGKKPTMQDVLRLTNDGETNSSVGKLRPAVGKGGYWENAEKEIEKDFNDEMSKYFD